MADSSHNAFRILDLIAASPSAREDPCPRLSKLRSRYPVHRDDAAGAWLVMRMAHARAIFSDNSHFKNPDKAAPSAIAIRRRATVPEGLSFPDDQRASMLELDGGRTSAQALLAHAWRRNTCSRASSFTFRNVALPMKKRRFAGGASRGFAALNASTFV